MSIEHPLLRLGVAGFSAGQRAALADALDECPSDACLWEIGELQAADAWCLNGARLARQPGGRLRVAPGDAGEAVLDLHLPEVSRPLAFAAPLPRAVEAPLVFALEQTASVHAVLARFEEWLAPVRALFCLGAHIAEREAPVGPGMHQISASGRLLAVVDMHGDAAVLSGIRPDDFEHAVWTRLPAPQPIPAGFCRASLSQVMWHYAGRTQRDMLPERYRATLLYWRRPPRLPQRLLSDEHLLVMRTLISGPATFAELELLCGIPAGRLARLLAALYFVGCITSNPRRAATGPVSTGPRPPTVQGGLPGTRLSRPMDDLTTPAGLPPR